MKTDSLALALAILSTSFYGSLHCAAMCSPVASYMAKKNLALSYHLGRGVSYTAIGALGGYLGSLFLESQFQSLRIIAAILFAAVLIFFGLNLFQQKTNSGWNFMHRFYSNKLPGFILGLLTVFLPCGWLYSYVLAAIATKSPVAGALVTFLFWIGGLPILSGIGLYMKKAIITSSPQRQKIAGVVLIIAGLYSVISFFYFN